MGNDSVCPCLIRGAEPNVAVRIMDAVVSLRGKETLDAAENR